MKYISLVCARGGSKGIPNKNIRFLGEKPLIGWSIKVSNSIERISKTIVSTDSKEIAKIAEEEGAIVPFFRPKELAQDTSSEWLVWQHALNYLQENGEKKIDGLVIIPPTAPLRSGIDIEKCLDQFEKGNADVIITVTEAQRSPFFNMVKNNSAGLSSLVIPLTNKIARRQDTPEVYDMTTVAYVVRPDFLLKSSNLFEGKVQSVFVPPERAIDIDTPLDLKIAEFLLKDNYREKNEENN